ncbi:MAG: hypothetical protein ABI574_13250 [Burkholderiales bacterium]
MSAYILIMVIGWGVSQGGVTSITAEFSSIAACEAARKWSAESVRKSSQGLVVSQGCFKKG